MEERRDNHQEADKSAIVTKTNSGWGFRKPKLERKRSSKWNLGFIRKHVDWSAEAIIPHCLGQRGTPKAVPPRETRKDDFGRIEESMCSFKLLRGVTSKF